MRCWSTRHAAPVVFPVDFDGGEHVYRVHPINIQLVTGLVIMPAKEELGWVSVSENLDKHEPRDILNCHVERRDQQPGSHRLNRSINPLDVNIAALRADNLDSTHRWRFITT